MHLDLTDEQRAVREMARKFADEYIVPVARDNDVHERFPGDIIAKMGALGLLGGPVPPEYGGAGLDYISHALVTEEIGKACSSVRTTISVQISLVELSLARWGTEEQRQRYLPAMCNGRLIGCFGLTEPNAGSDPSGMETTAVADGDHWVLNGHKIWISNGGVAGLAIVFAQTDKSLGHRGIGAFLVDRGTAGFSTRDMHGKLGLRASNTGELFLEDCRIPKGQVLGKVGEGFKVAMSALDNGRYSVAAGCVGICQGCVDASVRYAKDRKQFGRAIGSFQMVQDLIARMIVDTEAARLLVFRAGHLKNQRLRCTREISIAKYFASEAAVRCALDAIQVLGSYGYSNEYPVERYLRDAKVATIYEGTSQIQKLLIASHDLGIRAFV
ncbi:MAG TPA: acyl-CoA dehydrogenase family protein [Candidatus Tectomicrobia bacterium]|nr:acyl-CoA dehydrogenase family protein [Candidatus Tectomicrobia bacterium]